MNSEQSVFRFTLLPSLGIPVIDYFVPFRSEDVILLRLQRLDAKAQICCFNPLH